MTSRKEHQKQFNITCCKKEVARREKVNRRTARRKLKLKRRGITYTPNTARKSRKSVRSHTLKAPSILSLCQDSNDTVNFFDKVIWTIRECGVRDSIFFDLSGVTAITPDAVMYLIAIVKNMRRIKAYQIACSGSLPQEQSARDVIEQTGFYSYMKMSRLRRIDGDGRYMQISTGVTADGELASSFCDFVQTKCGRTICETKKLYPMIIELMTNTHQHAYRDENSIMAPNWYISAYLTDLGVHFVFLDTGAGIPATVHKKISERVFGPIIKNDSDYLVSALRGEFRTETRQEHRGKGLPGIYEDSSTHEIENLSIVSNKGKCIINGKNITTEKLSHGLEGTLFSWDILNSVKLEEIA